MQITIDILKRWRAAGKKIAIYCAGKHGRNFFRIFRTLGLPINFYLDSDQRKWNTVIDGIPCYEPSKAANDPDLLVFICVAPQQYAAVLEDARQIGAFQVADFSDIMDDLILHNPEAYLKLIELGEELDPADELYQLPSRSANVFGCSCGVALSSRTEPIAVYTGIFGGYDEVCIPRAHPANVDYWFVSDVRPADLGPFRWMDAKMFIPQEIHSPIKRNRYIKMHPHQLFPDYKYAIYIDGNITITGDITSFLPCGKSGISVFMHPQRDCIFFEAASIVNFRRVVAEDVCRQMRRYLQEGMPLHYGLPEMPVIGAELENPACRKVLEDWWQEFDREAQRDQLSFMYAMWKNGLGLSDLSSLGSDVRSCNCLYQNRHTEESKGISNSG